jgi:leucyl aminopeptidase
MPSNDLTPEAFMKHVKSFKWRSTKVKILTPKDIEKK